jgi:uncharacterized membrane protein
MSFEFLTLRLLHILCGMFWVGSGLYSTFFMIPALQKAGPAAGPIFAELQRRKLFTVLPLVAITTMLTGARLLGIVSGGFQAAYFHTLSGRTYAWAGVASILAFVIALVVARPAGVKLASLPPTASDAERASLKRHSNIATVVAMSLLTLAAVGMSIARYL